MATRISRGATRTPRKAAQKQQPPVKELDSIMAPITEQFGKGSIIRMGANEIIETEAISTGSLSLDAALGIGGFPRGRVIEIFGAESCGKTTLALHVVAEAQKGGGVAAFVDAEHALDPIYARRLGVDVDNLLLSQPDTGEQALEIVDILVRGGKVDVVVVDSVAALVPKAELEGEMGDVHMGLQARLMSQALRKLSGNISKTNTCVVFVNQTREKIGIKFGNPIVTPGGRALKFASSIRIDIRRKGNIKVGDQIVGIQAVAKVVKNKFAAPFKSGEFEIAFGRGICKYGEVLDMGVVHGVVAQKGAWFLFGDECIGQGRERARNNLMKNEQLYETIRAQLIARMVV